MTRVATMGTSSCATIAISGFKPADMQLDKDYQSDPTSVSFPAEGEEGSVVEFYNNVLYPTSQPLGKSGEYPFTALMEAIDEYSLKSKFIILTLNKHQTQVSSGYWLTQLEKWGFSLIDKTNNEIGQVCFIYTRNLNRVE